MNNYCSVFTMPRSEVCRCQSEPFQRVVERDFFIREARLLPACPCGADVLCKLNQFFNHLRRGQSVVVIAGNGRLKPLRERLCLSDVALGL